MTMTMTMTMMMLMLMVVVVVMMMERGRQEVLTGCEEALEEANKSRKKNLFVKRNLLEL